MPKKNSKIIGKFTQNVLKLKEGPVIEILKWSRRQGPA